MRINNWHRRWKYKGYRPYSSAAISLREYQRYADDYRNFMRSKIGAHIMKVLNGDSE
jgi:hypothetical protein